MVLNQGLVLFYKNKWGRCAMMWQARLRQDKRVRVAVLLALAVLILILLILFVRGCGAAPAKQEAEKTPTSPKQEALLVPEDLAERFGLDRTGILDYSRREIAGANYRGVLRGAHGALWAGEANTWDRVLLAAAALEAEGVETRIILEDPPRIAYRDGGWVTLRLDVDEVQAEVSDELLPDAVRPSELEDARPELFHQIVPAFLLEGGQGEPRRIEGEAESILEWVYRPVIVEAVQDGNGLQYVLRVGEERRLASGVLDGADRVVLELTWRFENRQQTWTRELFDRANAAPEIPGHDQPRAGDRYAVVVATGPLVPEVLETRQRMLELERYTPLAEPLEQDLVVQGTKYLVDSDKYTRQLAAKTDTKVTWHVPRITIAAAEMPAQPVSQPSAGEYTLDNRRIHSLDALADAVAAHGKQARRFQTARGMANDQIETRVLFEATQIPVVSASTVLSRYMSPNQNSPERRIDLIEKEAARLLAEEPYGTRVELIADRPPGLEPQDEQTSSGAEGKGFPKLVVERTSEGLRLHGLKEDVRAEEGPLWNWYSWDEAGSVSFGDDAAATAVVADVMLAHEMQDSNYLLRFKVTRPMGQLSITNGSMLTYRVTHQGKAYWLNALVSMKEGIPRGLWVTTPAEQRGWSSLDTRAGRRIGEIVGQWPDVISITPVGPRVESYVAQAEVGTEGERERLQVTVGGSEQTIEGVWAVVPRPRELFLEAESSGRWYAAVFVREDGLLRTKNDTYRVHYIGYSDSEDEWLPRSRIRPVQPMEMQVDNQWQWVNVLERAENRYLVHHPGEDDSATEWVAADRLRPVELAEVESGGSWQVVNVLEARGNEFRIRYLGSAESEDEWVPSQRIRLPAQDEHPQAQALLLPGRGLPLVLAWQQGETEMVLESVTPAVKGHLVDERTGLPVSGAEIARADEGEGIIELQNQWSVRSAADGSLLMPVVPVTIIYNDPPPAWRHPTIRARESHRVVLLMADSQAMGEVVGEKPEGDAPAPRRIELARQLVERLSEELPFGYDDIRLALWVYAAPIDHSGTFEDPELVSQEILSTEHVARVLDSLEELKLEGRSPLTAAINKLATELGEEDARENTTVVLISDGENVYTTQSAVDAYQQGNLSVPIHVVGLGVEPGTENDRRLQQLARVSKGHYWRINATADLNAAFEAFEGEAGEEIRLQIRSSCYASEEVTIPLTELGNEVEPIPLRSGCATCQCEEKKLLTIHQENVEELEKAEGLSPKAQRMIQERVQDGRWTVTIPARRTNLGPVTAYGWFETDTATGRIVGRTEDGLHGSSAAGLGNWPAYEPSDFDPRDFAPASRTGIVAWQEGIVAYTAGSVKAAFDWRNSPGFLQGSADDFARFVQANALDYVVDVWGEQRDDAFWSGVCLNFTLQSAALQLPSAACHRRWFEDACLRMMDELKERAQEGLTQSVSGYLNENFGAEMGTLLIEVGEYSAQDVFQQIENRWNEGKQIVCESLTERIFVEGP